MNNEPSYDLVIVAHEKDFSHIKFIVEQSEYNLNFDSIHLILSEREPFNDLDILKGITKKPIYLHNETDVLKIDRSRLEYRPNWTYQIFLKLFQNVTKNDNFLVIEADSVILKPLNFFEDGKTIFYLGRDYKHEPYFTFNKNVLGLSERFNHSFVCEFMMYNKKIIKDMLLKCNCNTPEDFLELVYKNISEYCVPADYEIYGNFVYEHHNDKFLTKNVTYELHGRDGRSEKFTDDDIKTLIERNKDLESLSFHVWHLN